MKYPIFSNWIRYERLPDQDAYYVKNYIQETVNIVPSEKMKYAKRLDGKTDPYSIRGEKSISEIEGLLCELENMGVIRTDHGSIPNDDGLHVRTIIRTKSEKYKRSISKKLNYLLMVFFIPLLILGVLVYLHTDDVWYHNLSSFGRFVEEHITLFIWIFNFGSLIIGGIVHELCHGIACRAYGGRVFEYGVMIHVLPGLYTLMDDTRIKSTLKRTQILAAGVEGNIAVAGVLLLLTGVFPELKLVLSVGAVVNIVCVFLNLLPLNGSDGMKILLLLIGVEAEDIDDVKRLTKQRSKSGLGDEDFGVARLVACKIILMFSKIYPVVIILDVIAMVGAVI